MYVVGRMDHFSEMCIRFHFGGQFTFVGGSRFYVGGDIGESWIDVDKLSFFEIKGHLADHYNPPSVLRMYWLKLGMMVSNGLVLLVDDASCQVMASYHSRGECVDMYVEEVGMEINADDQDIWLGDDEAGDGQGGDKVGDVDVSDGSSDNEVGADDLGSPNVEDKEHRSFMAFYRSPAKSSDKGKGLAEEADEDDDEEEEEEELGDNSSDDDESDEEYKQPVDEDSSAEDEEANELRHYAR
jgi:hypothetical protein